MRKTTNGEVMKDILNEEQMALMSVDVLEVRLTRFKWDHKQKIVVLLVYAAFSGLLFAIGGILTYFGALYALGVAGNTFKAILRMKYIAMIESVIAYKTIKD